MQDTHSLRSLPARISWRRCSCFGIQKTPRAESTPCQHAVSVCFGASGRCCPEFHKPDHAGATHDPTWDRLCHTLPFWSAATCGRCATPPPLMQIQMRSHNSGRVLPVPHLVVLLHVVMQRVGQLLLLQHLRTHRTRHRPEASPTRSHAYKKEWLGCEVKQAETTYPHHSPRHVLDKCAVRTVDMHQGDCSRGLEACGLVEEHFPRGC